MFALVEIQPLDPASGARTVVRVASSHNLDQTGWDDEVWIPAIASPGALDEQYFDGDFTSPISTSQLSMTIASQPLADLLPDVLAMRWQDSPVKLWLADDAASPALTLQGEIVRFERSDGLIKISVSPGAKAGDTEVLGLTYAGTSGAEGGTDLKGALKPMLLGTVRNAEPVQIDVPNDVWQFHAYGPLKAVNEMFERGASFGSGSNVGDFANYTALVAATIPPGKWGTCLASGMIRLGAPQYGVITGDVEGDYTGSVFAERTGAIIQRIATLRSVSSDNIDAVSMAALDTFAATLPGGGKIGLYLTEQTTLIELAQRLCLPLNAQAGFSRLGKLFAMRVGLFTPTFTLDALGRELPVVSEMFEADTLPPYKCIVMGGDRSWRVHSLEEIAFNLNLIDRGDYDAAETYREGNIVRTPGGSTWVYVNPAPSVGNTPAEDAYWDQLTGPTTYSDGTEIDDLQPVEAGSDVTATSQIVVVPPPAQIIHRSWQGVARDAARVLTPIIKRGETDIRTDDSVTVAVTEPSGFDLTVNTTNGNADKGRITFADAVAGTPLMTVTVGTVDYGPFAIPFSVQDDSPPIDQGSTGGSDSTLANVTSTSFSQMASTDPGEALFTVTVGTGQKIVGIAPIIYRITTSSGGASVSLICKWQYRLVGDTTWLDFPTGAITATTPATWVAADFEGEPGSGNFNDEKTGLTAGDYEVRLVGAKSSGAGNDITIETGTATVRVQS